jgi:nitrous oxidase accessory protein NosD
MKKCVNFLLVVFALTLISTFAYANTIKVNCNKGKTISDALSKANSGDTINVSGICNENITITKDRINLIADINTTIRGGGSDVITLDNVRGIVIVGFLIEDGGFGLALNASSASCSNILLQDNLAYSGIYVADNSHLTLKQSVVKNNKMGVAVYRNSSLVINDSQCSDNTENGLDIWYSSTARASNNNIEGNGKIGIQVGAGSSVRLSGNHISGNRESGIGLTQQATAALRGGNIIANNASTLEEWVAGINLNFGSSAVIDDYENLGRNQITGNSGAGIHVSSQSVVFLTSARIASNSGDGIYLAMNSTAQFQDNVSITNNTGWGIYCPDWDGDSKWAGEVSFISNGSGDSLCGKYW